MGREAALPGQSRAAPVRGPLGEVDLSDLSLSPAVISRQRYLFACGAADLVGWWQDRRERQRLVTREVPVLR